MGNSLIYDDGSYVGIGITVPSNRLDVYTSQNSTNAISGVNNSAASGTSWNPGSNYAGISGQGAAGSAQYQAGVYGYDMGSGKNTGGVVGAYDANNWSGLGYVDGAGNTWALYSSAKSYFNGQVNIVDGTQGLHKVFTSDANGLGSWQTLSSWGDTINGTKNYIPLFTSATGIGNSVIYQNGPYIGIGTVSPSFPLDVSTSLPGTMRLATSSSNNYLEFYTGTSTYQGYVGVFSLPNSMDFGTGGSNFTGSTNLVTSATPRLTVSPTGMIGIGTTAPTHRLEVVSSTDTALVLIRSTVLPSTAGTVRIEYGGSTDERGRVGLLSTTVNNLANVYGTGIEGIGNATGVYGLGQSSATGGTDVYGVEGDAYGSAYSSIGVIGFAFNYGSAPNVCYGVYGYAAGGTTNYAMYAEGAMRVNGALSKASGTFEIDHPLDPANKYLYHSFVESPDMMNIYNGNITTDANGIATVTLPHYFDTLNKDFRYQLTTLGQPAQVWIAEKISGNRFVIKSDKPNVEISWMVTGVRKDAWANAHRVVAEVDKAASDKGKYLHPEELGLPDTLRIGSEIKPKPRTGAEMAAPSKK